MGSLPAIDNHTTLGQNQIEEQDQRVCQQPVFHPTSCTDFHTQGEAAATDRLAHGIIAIPAQLNQQTSVISSGKDDSGTETAQQYQPPFSALSGGIGMVDTII